MRNIPNLFILHIAHFDKINSQFPSLALTTATVLFIYNLMYNISISYNKYGTNLKIC